MAELRGAQLPSDDALKALGSSLSGFPESVVERACQKLENATQGQYEARMPTLAMLMDACRDATKTPPVKSKYCGRCREGVTGGSDGKIRYCECFCPDCNNGGMKIVHKTIKGYEAPIGFAVRCHCQRMAA